MNLLRIGILENLKPSKTPMEFTIDLLSDEDPLTKDKDYMRLVKSLQYLTLTQPNIMFVVNKVSKIMAEPQPVQWNVVKRIFHSLKNSNNGD